MCLKMICAFEKVGSRILFTLFNSNRLIAIAAAILAGLCRSKNSICHELQQGADEMQKRVTRRLRYCSPGSAVWPYFLSRSIKQDYGKR
jgi:hypothetical protein